MINGIEKNFLCKIDNLLLKKKIKKKYPIFFVIGNPCSGTTLTHQFLAKTGKFLYISNFLSKFHQLPLFGGKIEKLFKISDYRKIKFESINGRTNGISNVSEFGFFWKRIFHDNVKIPSENLYINNLKQADLILHNLTNMFDLPLIIKNNTFITMNLSLVSKYITNSYFIYSKRDTLEIAQSILNARIKQKKSKSKWWSIKPLNFKKVLNKSFSDQIVFQILSIENEIKKEISSIKKSIIIQSKYESFCKRPNHIISLINKIFTIYGIEAINYENISFKIQKGKRVGKEDFLKLQKSLEKFKKN